MLFFALNTSRSLGQAISTHLHVPLSRHEERDFEDGEHKIRPLENVRGKDVFVPHSLYGEAGQSVNDKLCKLLFFTAALRDAGAMRVSTVVPYFAYARKDRRTKPYDPVTMKYMAQLLEAVGVNQVVTLDIHNPAAFQNALRIPCENLEARVLFAPYVAALVGGGKVAVVSPDPGGVKRAEQFRDTLAVLLGREVAMAFLDKGRSEGILKGEALIGDVESATAIVFDDIISSGATLARAIVTLKSHGAGRILAAATHGLFNARASDLLARPELETVLVTNSVGTVRIPTADNGRAAQKLLSVDCAPLFAAAIRTLHANGSIPDLLEHYSGTLMQQLML